jgi:hypothetical protein
VSILLFSCITQKDNNVIILNKGENVTIIKNQEDRNNFEKDYYNYTIKYNTNIECMQNDPMKILLKTKAGCSQTGFKIKNNYYDNFEYISNNIFVISTIDDLRQIKDKYIELPFLEEFSINYFEENYLILVLASYTASAELRNEHTEKNDGKYFLLWKIG